MSRKHSDIEMANMILNTDKCQYSAEDAYMALIRLRERTNQERIDTVANMRKAQMAAQPSPSDGGSQMTTESEQNKCMAQVAVFQSNSFTNLLLGIIIALMLLNMLIKD